MCNYRHFHSRQIKIQAEFQRAITLRTAVQPFYLLTDEPEVCRILQAHSRRHWFACCITGQFSVSSTAPVWPMDHAGLGATLVRSRTPTLRCGGNEHRARLCAEFAVLLK